MSLKKQIILKDITFILIMLSLSFLVLAIICLIILIFLMLRFEYIIKEIRKISEDPGGYFKFGQLIILFFAIISFLGILAYNILIPQEVSSTDVFLAVIVGILGTTLGIFYGSKAEKYISEPRRRVLDRFVRLDEKAPEIISDLTKRIRELEDELRNKSK